MVKTTEKKSNIKNPTSHLLLAKITFEATAHIFERSVVHHSTGQTCMLLHCSTSQSELYAAEAENFTSCILAEKTVGRL